MSDYQDKELSVKIQYLDRKIERLNGEISKCQEEIDNMQFNIWHQETENEILRAQEIYQVLVERREVDILNLKSDLKSLRQSKTNEIEAINEEKKITEKIRASLIAKRDNID